MTRLRAALAALLLLSSVALRGESLDLRQTFQVPLPASLGGTGAATLTGLVLGTGTSAFTAYGGATCTNQFIRTLDASGSPTCASVANADLAGSIAASKLVGTDIATVGTITTGTWTGTAIAAANGGTGQTSYTTGDLLYASGATALSKLADVAAGSYLRSGGVTTVPVWSSTTLPNSATTGDILYASGTNAYANLAAAAYGKVLTAQGTGTAPAYVDPIAPGDLVFIEEFPPGSAAVLAIGTHGWNVRTIGAAPTNSYVNPTSGSTSGVYRMTTTASTGQGGALCIDSNGTTLLSAFTTLPGAMDAYIRFALGQTTTTRVRVGLLAGGTNTVQPVDGIFIRYDTNAGFADTNYMLCRRKSSDSEACVSLGVAADTSFHTFHIYTTTSSPTTVNATIDGGSVVCMTTAGSGCGLNSTTFPTVALGPSNIVVTDANGAITADFDYWSLRLRGLSR
jgi:hypothetical protein